MTRRVINRNSFLGVMLLLRLVFMWAHAHAERFQPGQERTMSISRFLKDEAGTTAIEYAIIAAGISIVIVVAVNGMGTTLNTNFTTINASLK